MSLSKIKSHWLIFALIVLNLLIGLLIVRDYGQSFDEPRFIEYAHQSLDAYRQWIDPQYVPSFGKDDLRYYGPASAMLTALVSVLVRPIFPGVFEPDIWHYSYFVDFQITGLCLYFLAVRWFSRKTAFSLSLLFLMQPLLWGHAFINPKDIPFLMAFTLSLTLGLWAADKLPVGAAWPVNSLKAYWSRAGARTKRNALIGTLLWALCLVVLLPGWREIINLMSLLIRAMASGQYPLLSRFFQVIVSSSTNVPVENYILKADRIAQSIRIAALVLASLFVVYLYRPVFPEIYAWLRLDSPTGLLRKCLSFLGSPALLLAGLALGFAISTRIFGPWVGVLVSIYMLWRLRDNAIPAILVYALCAILCTYLTWPALWSDPVGGFFKSLTVMSNFPWLGKVLFDGVSYEPGLAPPQYLPVLMGLQFTEPVLILFGLGILKLAYDFRRKNSLPGLIWLVFGWGILPLFLIIVTNRPLYNNFRQLLFLMPPLFLVCGLSLEMLFKRFEQVWVFAALLVVLILPGAMPLMTLHPYQYVYYNSLIGGTAGAADRYELDYWVTSYAEAMHYVDRVAAPGAKVLVWRNVDLAQPYARPDLLLANQHDVGERKFDYLVISSLNGRDEISYPAAPVIFTIQRDGAVFSVVKKISP